MYYWVAALLPKEAEKEIRDICLPLLKGGGISDLAFLLTQHISLKISFASSEEKNMMEYLSGFFKNLRPFEVEAERVECQKGIVWIRMKPNRSLEEIHKKLVEGLFDIFQITPHEFDREFVFHTTLAMDRDQSKIEWLYAQTKDLFQGRKALVKAIIIGTSETGADGTWRELRRIPLNQT